MSVDFTRPEVRNRGSLTALAEALGSGHRVNHEWMEQAECRQRVELHGGKEYTRVTEWKGGKKFEQLVDIDEWSAPRGDDDKSVRKLREICARCPVRRECLVWSFQSPDSIQFGLYAGTVGRQRMHYGNYADPVGRLSRWFEGWRTARDRVAYERRTRRESNNEASLEAVGR